MVQEEERKTRIPYRSSFDHPDPSKPDSFSTTTDLQPAIISKSNQDLSRPVDLSPTTQLVDPD